MALESSEAGNRKLKEENMAQCGNENNVIISINEKHISYQYQYQ